MQPHFEEFHRSALVRNPEPTISLQRKGLLSLNKAAFEALGEPQAVGLLYDRTLRIIGLRAMKPEALDAFKVRRPTRSSGCMVSATAFCKHFGISLGTTRRYAAHKYGDVLGVQLEAE